LGWSSISLPNLNWVSFLVSSTLDIKYLRVSDVNEESSLVLEDLPPSWVGGPNLHFVGLSTADDIETLVVDSALDGSCWSIEVPFLRSSTVLSLNDQVSSG
jgi:hypothetical protein